MTPRVMFVQLSAVDVAARCAKEKVGISSIEHIPSGGVRLVCMSVQGADLMRGKFKSHLIKGDVVREKHRPASPLW